MKLGKIILIVAIVALIGGGGYYGYRWLKKSGQPVSMYSFVPNESVVVFNCKNGGQIFQEFSKEPALNSLLTISAFKELSDNLKLLETVLSYEAYDLGTIFNEKNELLLSLTFKDSKIEPFAVFTIDESQKEVFQKIYGTSLADKNKLTAKGHDLFAFKHDSLNRELYFTFVNNLFLVGFEPGIFSEVLATDKHPKLFERQFEEVRKNETVSSGLHVYINYKELAVFISEITRGDDLSSLASVANFSFLDGHTAGNEFNFSGYTYSEDSISTFIDAFTNQTPGYFEVRSIISNRTALLYYWGFDNYQRLNASLDDYWYTNFKNNEEQRQVKFMETYAIELDKFNSLISGEVALSVLEVQDGYHDKLTYVQSPDVRELDKLIDRISVSVSGRDSVDYEIFSSTKIKRCSVSELPELLFGQHFEGYEKCFYAIIDDYVVLGNSAASIKLLLTDILADNVWGKTVKINRFLEDSFEKANVGIFVNTQNAWGSILELCANEYLPTIETLKSDFDKIQMLSLTYSHEESNSKVYSSGAFKFNQETPLFVENRVDTAQNVITKIDLKHEIVAGPYLVKNHNDGSNEIVVGMSDSSLALISGNGKVLWRTKLDGIVNSKIEQVDIYRNGKLQYVFSTQNKVHCYDRNGKKVENYPFHLPNRGVIATFSVIDYDKSRKYRLLASDTLGNMFMFDVKGENLKGWDPNKLPTVLGSPVRHVRTRGKDFLVAIEKKGVLNVFNRRGAQVSDFPIPLPKPVSSPIVVEIGPSVRKSYINILTDDNEYFEIGFNGKITANELIKSSEGITKVVMMENAEVNMPVFVVLTSDKARFLRHDLKLMFDVALENTGMASTIRVGDRAFYALNVVDDQLIMIYDSKGKPLTKNPIDGEGLVGLNYNNITKVYTAYTALGTQLLISTFQ